MKMEKFSLLLIGGITVVNINAACCKSYSSKDPIVDALECFKQGASKESDVVEYVKKLKECLNDNGKLDETKAFEMEGYVRSLNNTDYFYINTQYKLEYKDGNWKAMKGKYMELTELTEGSDLEIDKNECILKLYKVEKTKDNKIPVEGLGTEEKGVKFLKVEEDDTLYIFSTNYSGDGYLSFDFVVCSKDGKYFTFNESKEDNLKNGVLSKDEGTESEPKGEEVESEEGGSSNSSSNIFVGRVSSERFKVKLSEANDKVKFKILKGTPKEVKFEIGEFE